MARDEDDAASCRHQRKRQPSQAHLRIAVEPHRVAGVGAALQSTGCVEHQHIQATERALMSSSIATTACSSVTSAWTALASPPAARTASTTSSARLAFSR